MLWLTYRSFYSQEIFICLPNSLVDAEMGVVKIFHARFLRNYVYGPPQPSTGSYAYAVTVAHHSNTQDLYHKRLFT